MSLPIRFCICTYISYSASSPPRGLAQFVNKASVASTSCTGLLAGSDLDVLRGFDLVDGKIEAAYANPVSTVPIAYDDLACTFSQDVESEVLGLVERYGAVSAGMNLRVCWHVCVCVCMCVCGCVCMHMCVCICACMHAYVCVHLCLYACVCVWVCMHAYVCARVCI